MLQSVFTNYLEKLVIPVIPSFCYFSASHQSSSGNQKGCWKSPHLVRWFPNEKNAIFRVAISQPAMFNCARVFRSWSSHLYSIYIYISLIHIIPCIYPIDYPIYIPFIPFICHLNAIYPRHPSHRPKPRRQDLQVRSNIPLEELKRHLMSLYVNPKVRFHDVHNESSLGIRY